MNRASFDALYREHYPRVLGLCRRMLGASEAEDAAREVFMRGYRTIGRYRDQPLGPWIAAIAASYETPEEPEYPFHNRAVRIIQCGRICIGRRKIDLRRVFAGQTVRIKEVADKICLVLILRCFS